MSYSVADKEGKTAYVFHSDREVCNDVECPCDLPTEAQQDARDRAESYNEWYVVWDSPRFGQQVYSHLSEKDAREAVGKRTQFRAKLLRVVEDYDA